MKKQQIRNKGEGSIVQFKATITLGKGIDGKQKRKSVTCKTKTELIDKLTELKAKFIKHHIVTNITFQAFTKQIYSLEHLKECFRIALESSQWLYMLLLLATTTGMRRGELVGLKWDSVDFVNNTITIDNQVTEAGIDSFLKTDSSYRTIKVSPSVLKELDKLPRSDSGY